MAGFGVTTEVSGGYSLASCSPAELASAFPTTHDFATIKNVRRANLSGRLVSNFATVSKRTAVHPICFREDGLTLAAAIAFALSPAVLLIIESCFQNLLDTGIVPALKALL